MKKKILSFFLVVCMLLPLIPVMAEASTSGLTETVSSFQTDKVVSVMPQPKTYGAYLTENGLTDSETSKEAYKTYYMENTKVTWSGAWTAGQTDRYTGEYEPFANLWWFNETTYWADAFKVTGWYATKANVESGLATYVSREAYNYIWGRDNFATAANVNSGQQSKSYTGYYTYSYIVPEDGTASPAIAAQNTQVKDSTCIMIMHNDTIVWPDGAVFDDPQTWETGHTAGTTLMAAVYGLSFDCKAGDQIRFVVTGEGFYTPNVQVTMATVAPPSEELFELKASTSLAEAFAVNFIATYKNETAAAAATATFTLAGNAVTPQITSTNNEDGTVTRYYTIQDLPARKLTETIGYNISCEALDDSKTASGTITVADLLSSHLLENGELVDADEATSALAMTSLNYAAAVQTYYNYNMTTLANAAVPESQRLPSVKVKDRNLSNLTYTETPGASLHMNEAALVLGDEVNIKFTIKADAAVDDLSTLKLRATRTDGTFSDDIGTFGYVEYVDGTTDKMQIRCYTAVPMLYYAEPMTYAIYQGDTLVSDTVVYGVGTYAKRMYGMNTKLDNILDTMLALGDAANTYVDRANHAVSANEAIPANPGETIDLGQYNVDFNGKRLSLTQVNCSIGASEMNRIADGRYLLAPTEPGEYPLVLEYNGEYMIVLLSVCDANGEHAVATLDKLELASIDLSGLGEKGAATSTWSDDLGYWTWALNLATYQAKKNDGGRNLPTALFINDMHWEFNNRNTAEVANYLTAELGIDRVFFGGDFMNGHDTYEGSMQVTNGWLEEMSTLDAYWYSVRGNHDTNSCWTPLTPEDVWHDYEYHDLVLAAEASGSGVYADRSAEGITISRKVTEAMGIKDKKGNILTEETDDCLFYYMDDANQKIRYYFLDDGGNGVFAQSYIDETGIRYTNTLDKVNVIPFEEQLKWLKYTATQGDDPLSEGWGIVAVEHQGLDPNTPANPVIKPSSSSAALATALIEVEKALTGVDVLCIIGGHNHWDGEYYIEEGGFYIVTTSNDSDTRSGTTHFLPELNSNSTHSGTIEINTNNRYPDTDAEQLMDIVQIDRANRKIYMTRLGDGFSRTYEY